MHTVSLDSKASGTRSANATGHIGGGAEVVKGGVRWIGWSDNEPNRAGATPAILGSAHGPRLLELLKAAC